MYNHINHNQEGGPLKHESKDRKALRRTLSNEVPKHVGTYFEELACTLFYGTADCPSGDADFANWSLDAGFEVKASDNNHHFRLPIAQLENHLESGRGFPFNNYAYCLFKYANRERRSVCLDGSRKSLLSKCKTPEQIRLVLAQNPVTLHILDISIMEAMLRKFGPSPNPRELGGEEVLEIHHRTLQKLTPRGGDKTESVAFLDQLGFPPGSFHIGTMPAIIPFRDGLLHMALQVLITRVLPSKFARQVDKVIVPVSRCTFIELAHAANS